MYSINISENYKKKTALAVLSILLFIVVYVLLMLLALGFTVVSVVVGGGLIYINPSLFTIVVGAGVIGMGLMIFFFIIKFMFQSQQNDLSNLVVLKEEDAPDLYALIRDIVRETGTHFPKKIYIAPDVNASVFYHSGFWSMFLPVRKNLLIGMGLVNAVNVSEFKAILAHEFGHFSQSTMKVGSYVYHVNRVIHSMLFDNEGYDAIVQKWANINGVIAFFAGIAVWIIHKIQWVLGKMYELVNKAYMGLSREMEFHADEIAAHVAGAEPLISSLLRLDLASYAYQQVLNSYEQRISKSVKTENIYPQHRYVMRFISHENDIPLVNGLPGIDENLLKKFRQSRLVVTDQWASHPSTEDRIAALKALHIPEVSPQMDSPRVMFTDVDQLEKQVTLLLFSNVVYSSKATNESPESFGEVYLKDYEESTFAKLFNGYYDQKDLKSFEGEILPDPVEDVASLFTQEMQDMASESFAIQQDIQSLKQLMEQTDIRSFDFDGHKYSIKDCDKLIEQLDKEASKLKEQLDRHDRLIYSTFNELAEKKGLTEIFHLLFRQFLESDKVFETEAQLHTEIHQSLAFITVVTPFEEISRNFSNLIPKEAQLKSKLKELIAEMDGRSFITDDVKEAAERYIQNELPYFSDNHYHDETLHILFDALSLYQFLLSKSYFLKKKTLLNFMEKLAAG